MQTLTFWWVDDEVTSRTAGLVRPHLESPRHPTLRAAGLGATLVEKVIPGGGDWTSVETTLAGLKPAERPDLIIIDQRLGSVHKAKRLGTSLAVILRAQAPDIPIVLTSAAAADSVVSEQRKGVIDFFAVASIQSGDRIPDLYAIATGFRRVLDAEIKPPVEKQLKTLLDLLSVPVGDRELFGHCLPPVFTHVWDDQTSHTFARWTWNELLCRAGFLQDDLGIATMLGLDVSCLSHLEKKLDGCTYDGAFVSPIRRRWWASLVRDRVLKLTKGTIDQPMWELGRSLVGSKHLTISRAYGHKTTDLPPDCVAFKDGLQKVRVAARTEDTVTLPFELPAPGFEPVRIFRKKAT